VHFLQPAYTPGFPNHTYLQDLHTAFESNATRDQRMDSRIEGASLERALLALPSVSLVGPTASFFGPQGFYECWWRGPYSALASFELLHPASPDQNVAVIAANLSGHSWPKIKRSMNVHFESEPLRTTILNDAPMGSTSLKHFHSVILRAVHNRGMSSKWINRSSYVEDQFHRELQGMASGYQDFGVWVHVYFNGVYWGIYEFAERINDNWASYTFGGHPNDFFLARDNKNFKISVEGNAQGLIEFNQILTWANGHLPGDSSPAGTNESRFYQQHLINLLDVSSFADYLLINWFVGKTDWPQNNWQVVSRMATSQREGMPLRFICTDAEFSFELSLNMNKPERGAWVHPLFWRNATHSSGSWIDLLFGRLISISQFRQLLADRAYTLTRIDPERSLGALWKKKSAQFPGLRGLGAFSSASTTRRWSALTSQLSLAIVAESARWGDVGLGVFHTRENTFLPQVESINRLLATNADDLLQSMRSQNYLSACDPPNFSPSSGVYDYDVFDSWLVLAPLCHHPDHSPDQACCEYANMIL
jgi:hypothetical protein